MSMAIMCTDCSSNISAPGLVFNPENRDLPETYREIRDDFLGHTNTFNRPNRDSKELLVNIYSECSEMNWDGQGALPVKEEALFEALRFIDNLPITVPMPTDMAADLNGYISMEWRRRRGLIFDITFTGNNEIIYAGIIGTSRPRGILYFGNNIPREIIENIQSIGI